MIRRWSEPPVETAESRPRGFDDFDLRIGDIMRGERATMGKSLLDVQRELRIKASFIAAIENADISAFETPGFIAGFVRSYARYLNLDPEWAFAKFCEESNFRTTHGMSAEASGPRPRTAKAPVAERPKAPRDPLVDTDTPFVPKAETLWSRIEPGALGSISVLVALIGVIGYGGWTVLQEIQRVQFAPVDQAPGVVADIGVLAEDAPQVADLGGAGAIETPSPDALSRLYRPEALDVPVMTSRDGPIAALDPSSVGALAPSALGLPAAAPTPPRPGGPNTDAAVAEALGLPVAADIQVTTPAAPEVVMFAVRPSWVRVRAADGTTLFEKILDAGESYVVPKMEIAPTLHAGNAGSVFFTVNGQPYGPAGEGGAVVRQIALGSSDLTSVFSQAELPTEIDLKKIIEDAIRQEQQR
ncbi:MAG: helix-turn-helix domain-containing protein [Paracoccaceae bacterium]